MKTERVALFVVELAFNLAERIAGWLEAREKKAKAAPSGLSLKELLEIKRLNDSQVRRTQAPTVVIPPPSEREKRGGGSSRY
jgi:hypothetical protein